MKYIKCNHCSNFNNINSEYQIFCDACGKKLTTNFKDWQKKFPSKNFKDFTNEIGIEKIVKPAKKTSLKKVIQICVIVLFSTIGSFLGKKYSNQIFSFFHEMAYPVSEVLDKPWERQFFLGNKISIEAPYILEKNEEELVFPDEVKKLIKTLNRYEYKTFGGFAAVILIAEYNKELKTVDLQGAADGGISQSVRELNGSNVFYNDEETTIHGYPAIIKKGTFNTENDLIHFKTITSVKNNLTLISLITFWVKKHNEYDLLTDRMINSLIIE